MNQRHLKQSIDGIRRMILSRQNSLWMMKRFLEDPVNCDQLYKYKTIYTRGPVLVAEIHRLKIIKRQLWSLLKRKKRPLLVKCV